MFSQEAFPVLNADTASSPHCRGTVTSAATGKKVAWIDGKWDSKLDIKYGPHDPAHLLWETHPWPPNAEKYYGVRG